MNTIRNGNSAEVGPFCVSNNHFHRETNTTPDGIDGKGKSQDHQCGFDGSQVGSFTCDC